MSWNVKRVLVPYDFSEHATAALEKALELVDSPEDIQILHVLPFMTPTEPGVGWGVVSDFYRLEKTDLALHRYLPAHRYGDLSLRTTIGDPGTVIAQRAEEIDADLVVMGSHGRTGISRFLLGSVADRAMRLCKRPVLITRLDSKLKEQEPASNQNFVEDAVSRESVVLF